VPEPTRRERVKWQLPDVHRLPPALADEDLVGIGGDLEPETLLAAYRSGLFPMHVDLESEGVRNEVIGWWCPQPRGVLPLDAFRLTRSLRQSVRRYATTIDAAFAEVMDACADRPGQWINDAIKVAYLRLFELGWAHSIETWHEGRLVGGLYGVSIGGLFAGESMFHGERDASKVALARLVDLLAQDGEKRLLDVQWVTDHLASLGAVEVARETYLDMLESALLLPPSPGWTEGVRHVRRASSPAAPEPPDLR
jgi:leucyl/phenylalanyl-tRNA--protein transferase